MISKSNRVKRLLFFPPEILAHPTGPKFHALQFEIIRFYVLPTADEIFFQIHDRLILKC